MNEVCNMPNECAPARPENIKERMLKTVDMQYKAIELLSAMRREVTGTENNDRPIPVATCMDDVASQQCENMQFILELIYHVKDALGVNA